MPLLQKWLLCHQTLVTCLIPTGSPVALSFSDIEKISNASSLTLTSPEIVGWHFPNQLFTWLSFLISLFYLQLHPLITYHISLVLCQSHETCVQHGGSLLLKSIFFSYPCFIGIFLQLRALTKISKRYTKIIQRYTKRYTENDIWKDIFFKKNRIWIIFQHEELWMYGLHLKIDVIWWHLSIAVFRICSSLRKSDSIVNGSDERASLMSATFDVNSRIFKK